MQYQAVRTLFRAYPDFAQVSALPVVGSLSPGDYRQPPANTSSPRPLVQATVREIGKRYIGPWGEEGRRGTVGQPSERGAPGG